MEHTIQKLPQSVEIAVVEPEPEKLSKVRQEIDYNGDRLKKIFADKKFKKYFTGFWDEDKLKRTPKGYAEDHPHAEWLKLKSFIVTHEFTDKEVLDKKFMKEVVRVMKSSKSIIDFLSEALA